MNLIKVSNIVWTWYSDMSDWDANEYDELPEKLVIAVGDKDSAMFDEYGFDGIASMLEDWYNWSIESAKCERYTGKNRLPDIDFTNYV